MKHAYLILAHNEPELLSLLVERLDDVRNDIYIHFDRKLSVLPNIKTSMLDSTSSRIEWMCAGLM